MARRLARSFAVVFSVLIEALVLCVMCLFAVLLVHRSGPERMSAIVYVVIEELFESFAASSFSTPGLTMFKAGSDFGPASFGIQLGPDLTSSQIQDAFKTETNGEWIKSEIQPSIKATAGGSSSEGRRKQSFPQRLSEKKAALAVKVEARERGSLAAWAGGSRYEVDHEPWTIQGWFMSGLRTGFAATKVYV